MKKFFAVALLVLLLVPNTTRAGEEYGWRLAATLTDIFIARPFTFAATVVGGAIWTVALPITVPTKTTRDSFDALVRQPSDLTFQRELGDFAEH
jgi:hypothetical protein